MANADVRWLQRLEKYERALATLERALTLAASRPLSELEQQGLIQAFEFTHEPSAINGLRKRSQLMVDKLFTVPIGDIGSSIGCLETTVMAELDLALRDWLALY
jgi:type II secretory pathway component PulJ